MFYMWQSHNITVHISAVELSSCQFQPCVCESQPARDATRSVQSRHPVHLFTEVCGFFLEVTLL